MLQFNTKMRIDVVSDTIIESLRNIDYKYE